MCTTPISRDGINTVPVTDATAILGKVGAMVRTHALIRNEGVEPGGYVTFNAGRDLSFMVRLNTGGDYDLTAIHNHGAPVACMHDLSKDALGLAILTIVDRA